MFHDHKSDIYNVEDLAQMGSDVIAYMREMTSEEISEAFPKTPELEENQTYWALFSADGAPLMLATERADITSSAFHNNLKTVLLN